MCDQNAAINDSMEARFHDSGLHRALTWDLYAMAGYTGRLLVHPAEEYLHNERLPEWLPHMKS